MNDFKVRVSKAPMTHIPATYGIGSGTLARLRAAASLDQPVPAEFFGIGSRGCRILTLITRGLLDWCEEGRTVRLTPKARALCL